MCGYLIHKQIITTVLIATYIRSQQYALLCLALYFLQPGIFDLHITTFVREPYIIYVAMSFRLLISSYPYTCIQDIHHRHNACIAISTYMNSYTYSTRTFYLIFQQLQLCKHIRICWKLILLAIYLEFINSASHIRIIFLCSYSSSYVSGGSA